MHLLVFFVALNRIDIIPAPKDNTALVRQIEANIKQYKKSHPYFTMGEYRMSYPFQAVAGDGLYR